MEQRHRGSNADPANEDCAIDPPKGDLHTLAFRPPLLDPVHRGDYHTGSETVAGSVRRTVLTGPGSEPARARQPPFAQALPGFGGRGEVESAR
jgi:hypothetical protein